MGNPKKSAISNEDLHTAARSGDLNVVQTICSANPLAINGRDKHSRTPLHLAAWSGHSQVVSYLCKNKADVGASAIDDMGAIHFASQKGHLEVIKTLLSSGVSLRSSNRKGMTALHYAAQGSHLELVKYLLKKGADPNAKNKAGKTPLDLAKNEEILLFFAEFQSGLNKGVTIKDKEDEEREGSVKRTQVNEEREEADLPEPKKAKIALNHLVAADDLQEEEEDDV